jgi:hypothetical protein
MQHKIAATASPTSKNEDAIAEFKEINGDADVRGARFVRVCFV